MNIFQKEILNLKTSSTFLLYADERIDLVGKAKEFTKLLMESEEENIFLNPDVLFYNEIKINDVRDIITTSSESTYSSKRKVYIINNIDITKKEALNSLLKVIEEPPLNVYFILLTKRMNILETIKSRSIKINLNRYFNIENVNENKEVYEFFENKIDYFEKFIKIKNEINLSDYKVKEFDDVYLYLEEYFKNPDIYNRIKYEYAIEYLIKELRFTLEEDLILIKDKLFNILSNSGENKITRVRMIEFFNSCINKYIKKYKVENIERLIEYKLSINSNINLKLVFLLFILNIC